MRRIIFAICTCLLLAGSAVAQEQLAMMGGIVGGGSGAVAGCSATTNYVGDQTQEATSMSIDTNKIYCYAATADCSGNINTAHIYHNGTTTGNIKLCVYNKTSTDPSAGDSLIACSDPIAMLNSAAWRTGPIGSVSVVKDNAYWVCFSSSANNVETARGATISRYYKAITYGSEPDPLGTGFSVNATTAPFSGWVGIGN
jgi:hypothetical protein